MHTYSTRGESPILEPGHMSRGLEGV
jgi:hypothetical protein